MLGRHFLLRGFVVVRLLCLPGRRPLTRFRNLQAITSQRPAARSPRAEVPFVLSLRASRLSALRFPRGYKASIQSGRPGTANGQTLAAGRPLGRSGNPRGLCLGGHRQTRTNGTGVVGCHRRGSSFSFQGHFTHLVAIEIYDGPGPNLLNGEMPHLRASFDPPGRLVVSGFQDQCHRPLGLIVTTARPAHLEFRGYHRRSNHRRSGCRLRRLLDRRLHLRQCRRIQVYRKRIRFRQQR